ncbi:MAG: transposase, partial [Treponema sp.]|nr:transposase [Treponema sp.]
MYPKECKAEAVALAEKREKPVIQVARDLGISDTVWHRWMQVSREAKGVHGRPRDEELDGKTLWLKSKKLVREYENDEGCLIFDDTIVEKAYMDENEINCWYYDHSKGR